MRDDMIQLKKLRENSIVIILYTVLTTVLTYPVVFKMTTHIAGGWDAWSVLWMFWYTKMAILYPNPDLTLTYTNYIFYPNGISVIPFGYAFNQLLSLPLQLLFGLGITYNLLWLFSFIVGGYGTYLLVKYLVDNKIAAFIAGIIFAFCPYHFAHALGHMGATTIEWIPFCALYLMKMTREKSLMNAVYAALFFILVAMSDLQYMVYMVFFIGLLFVYEVFSELRLNETLRDGFGKFMRRISSLKELVIKFMVFASVSFIGILPFTYHMIKIALSPSNFLKPSPYESICYSADLLGFFIPSSLHPLFGSWLSQNVYKFFTGNIAEYTTYIGYTVLILSLYTVITLRKRKEVRFWALSTLFFILMSLGPILHIYGRTQFTVFETTIPLPYIVVYYLVPFVSNGRTLGRFDVLVMLSFAVLAGYGISKFIKRFDIKWKRNIFVCLLTALLIFEFLAIPFVSSFVDKPVFYEQIAEDTGDYALLEIPATKVYECGIKLAYYQTIHGKPIVGGQVARTPACARDFELNIPLVRQLTYLEAPTNDILKQNGTEIGTSILNYYNIRYIILHKEYMSAEHLDFVNNLLQATLNEKPEIYDEDGLIVYKVEKEPIKSFMILSNNWHNLELWRNSPTRWTSNNATISIYSPGNRDSCLSFDVLNFYKPRTLQVCLNDELIHEQNIPTSFVELEIPVKLKEGENILRFYTPDGCQRPVDIPELENKDPRCLSLAFQNISIA